MLRSITLKTIVGLFCVLLIIPIISSAAQNLTVVRLAIALDFVPLRASPSTDSETVGELIPDEAVTILKDVPDGQQRTINGVTSSLWFRVKLSNGTQAFVFSLLVDVVEIEVAPEYWQLPTTTTGQLVYHEVDETIAYNWFTYIPQSIDKTQPVYILLAGLHGNVTTDAYETIVEQTRSLAWFRMDEAENHQYILLAPAIPRSPANYIYAVAFDRQVFWDSTHPFFQRPDLQVNLMMDQLISELRTAGYNIQDRVFIEGYSAGAMFAQRYTLLHPARVAAVGAGQCGGSLTLPESTYENYTMNWPVGINDLPSLVGYEFDRNTYKQVPQLIFIGDQDDNTTLWGLGELWHDQAELNFLLNTFGQTPPILLENQTEYMIDLGYPITFKLYPGLGHDYPYYVQEDVFEYFDSIRAILGVFEVETDIKPGDDLNSINCTHNKEVITVAILTTNTFDTTTVDHTAVTFEGASEFHVDKKTGISTRHEEDVDFDGDMDLVFHFRLGDTTLTCESTEGTLIGQTYDGVPIQGVDGVHIVPPDKTMIVESDDSIVKQTGAWTSHNTAAASGGSYLYNNGLSTDRLLLAFKGKMLKVVYVQHPALGTFVVEIDGATVQTVESQGEEAFGRTIEVDGLSNGTHQVRVYGENDGDVISIDAFVVEKALSIPTLTTTTVTDPVPPVTAGLARIESDNAAVQQGGTWDSFNAPNASGGSYLFSGGHESDTLSLDFTGTQVNIIYTKHNTPISFSIEVDGSVVGSISVSDPEGIFGWRASVTDLSFDEHTVRIVPIDGNIAIDAFEVEAEHN